MSLWDRTDNIILEWVYETGQSGMSLWDRTDNIITFVLLQFKDSDYPLSSNFSYTFWNCMYLCLSSPPSPHIIQVSKPWYKWLGSLVNILKTYIVQRWSTCFYCFTCIWELKELWKNTFVYSSSKKTDNKKLHWRFIRTIDISVLL